MVIVSLAVACHAAVKIEKIAYQGWPNCYRVANGEIELVVTADVGPRVMRCAFVGGRNLFWEDPQTLGQTGGDAWKLLGGHRLWVAPEARPRTYAPDNSPVEVKIEGATLRAMGPFEPSTGLQKEIIVRMADRGAAVEVAHRVHNRNLWPIELAPWALSMMAPGGTAVSAFPPRGGHEENLLPTNPLVMWAYTDFSDPRWKITRKYIVLRQDPKWEESQKTGFFNSDTWAAYLLGSEVFLKRAKADPSKLHVDFGCSFEMYTDANFLELETLGPLSKLEPGHNAEHVERWSLHRGVRLSAWTDDEIDRVILPLVRR